MTATEELRRMLDERGVEYVLDEEYGKKYPPEQRITWSCDIAGEDMTVTARDYCIGINDDGSSVYCLDLEFHEVFTPAQAVEATLGREVTGETSDGYHTFNELYHHRAVLFSVIVRDHRELAWKSKAHHDGTMYDGMFIVGIETPEGQATYHYDIDPYWDMFDCRELERAPEWDGHTPDDAIERIATLGRGTCHMVLREDMRGHAYQDTYECSECGEYVVRETYMGESEPPNFCPNCGAEVVS